MRKNLINITIVFAFVLGLFSPNTNQSVQAQENQVDNAQSDVVEVPTNRIIVKYKDGTNASVTPSLQPQMQRVSEASSWSLEYVREMSNDAHVLELPQRLSVQQVEAIAAQLETLPEVEYAEPDRIYQHLLVPNDTQFNNQWHYYDTWGINLPAAWETTTGSTDIVIAVVDTGITAHGDIDDRLVPGYDFISYDGEANDDADTSNVNERDNDPSDPGNWVTAGENASGYFAGCAITNSTWHGTHVAGTIGAESNNNSFVAGVDWNARILPVRVLGKCGGYTSDIVDGMRWAAGLTVSGVPANANPAHIINLSLGGAGACSTTEQNAITEIVNAGTVIVAAAGNNNINVSGFSPANCNGVIAVAATDEDGEKASYSNFGAGIDISAPGDGVVSLLDTGTQGPTGESYGSKSGTSMAAPHVSGVLGLMFAINPDLTPAQALTLLQDSAKAFPGGGSCTTSNCGAGIVDAVAAVNLTELPDLIITNVTLNPAEPVSGQPFDVLVTVKNQGGSTSESLVYRDVWVDRDPSTFIDPNTNCPIDSQEYESDYLREDFNASIPPGVSETLAVIIDNPPLTGSHQLWVYVDATCITAEGIEDNNGYGPINIGIAGFPDSWAGGVSIQSDQPVVSVGRPHIGAEIASYGGSSTGSLNSYIPMLFKAAFGGSYNSAFYVQNTNSTNTTNITIKYYSTAGVLNCTKSDTIAPLASKGYWVPTATCDTGSLPAGWAGAVVVTSNQSIVTVGRPHIGTEITTYDGFNSGATSYFLPMLFRNAFGGSYHSAVYVQNTNPTTTANVVIKFYSSDGVLNCILSDNIPANSTKGYWLPSLTCN